MIGVFRHWPFMGCWSAVYSNRKIPVGLFISKTIERMGESPVPFYGWMVNPAP